MRHRPNPPFKKTLFDKTQCIECRFFTASNVVFLNAMLYYSSMVKYISRPLAQTLKNTKAKVLVLEGARAVGKTMLVQRELPDYHYESLADESTYRYAKSHLLDWLESLPSGTIIDEAQRILGLPLAIKGIVDKTTDTATQFILTGSASITRNGLDGQDPLTRRSRRFLLNPLTRHEYYGNAAVSIVDKLWNYTPNPDYRSATSTSDIKRYMETGGFPSYIASNAFMTPAERRLAIQDDIDNVLGDTILPDEHLDKSIATSVLQELLATPGGILNLKRTADLVHIDARTVERYVSIFVSRFLIRTLPNLKTTANRQVLARSKVHPLDTSFSIATFRRSGKNPNQDRVLSGQIFESYVVNQIVPEAQWSDKRPDAFYWRESGSKPKEVDLVLVRDNELIGIEVKSNSNVDRTDFAGLSQLRAKDSRFKRGYVVYCGQHIQKFANDMWAIPVSALWDSDGFTHNQNLYSTDNILEHTKLSEMPNNTKMEALSESDYDANIFLSYSHNDNNYLDNAIVDFASNLVTAYRFQTGRELHLFADTDIHWGAEWRQVLDHNISKANILLAAVTPQYLGSNPCRQELLEFNARSGQHSGNKILSMIWQNIDAIPNSGNDPVLDIIHDKQFISVEDLTFEPSNTPSYKKRMAEIASKLKDVIDEQNNQIDQATNARIHLSSNTSSIGNRTNDFLSLMAEADKSADSLDEEMVIFTKSISNIIKRFSENPAPQNASATRLITWSNQIVDASENDVSSLNESTAHLSNIWSNYYIALQQYIDQVAYMPAGALRNQQINGLINNLDQLINSFTISDDIQHTASMITALGNLIRPLTPIMTSINNAFKFFSSIQMQATALRTRLNELSR